MEAASLMGDSIRVGSSTSRIRSSVDTEQCVTDRTAPGPLALVASIYPERFRPPAGSMGVRNAISSVKRYSSGRSTNNTNARAAWPQPSGVCGESGRMSRRNGRAPHLRPAWKGPPQREPFVTSGHMSSTPTTWAYQPVQETVMATPPCPSAKSCCRQTSHSARLDLSLPACGCKWRRFLTIEELVLSNASAIRGYL